MKTFYCEQPVSASDFASRTGAFRHLMLLLFHYGAHSRDAVMIFTHPDMNDDSARQALRKAITELEEDAHSVGMLIGERTVEAGPAVRVIRSPQLLAAAL